MRSIGTTQEHLRTNSGASPANQEQLRGSLKEAQESPGAAQEKARKKEKATQTKAAQDKPGNKPGVAQEEARKST